MRTITLRPLPLLALIGLLMIVAALLTIIFIHPSGTDKRTRLTMQALQQEKRTLNSKLAEAEAMLAVRDNQISSMQQLLQQDKQTIEAMQHRLDLFDDVLAARKVAGVHFLHPVVHWQDDHTIAYQLILVKGKNYPRWIIGHLTFRATSGKAHALTLQTGKKGNSGRKVEMTTQAFIEGNLHWPAAWRPSALHITLIDHKGRKKGSIAVPIEQPEGANP